MASPSPTPRAAVPPARAFGAKDTQARPTSRGRACFVSVLMGQWCGQTATGPRAGGGSAAGQSLWRRADAPMPHEQGAWALRFVPNGAVCVERRRQAHEQGPVACGGFLGGVGEGKEMDGGYAPPSKKNYPASAVRRCFFTRRSGRAETCGRLLPSPGDQRSGAWHPRKPTRNPFLNLWVKAQAWRTPQDNHWEHYSRRACRCQRGTGRFSTNCKT